MLREGGDAPPNSALSPLSDPERHVGTAVLLRALQSHEPHALHRLWHVPPGGHDRRVAYHPQHDRGGYLLRHVCGSRHGAHPVSGLVAAAVPGEGEWRQRVVVGRVFLVSV